MKKIVIGLFVVFGGFFACQSEAPIEQPAYEEATEETDDSSSDTTDDTAGDTTDDTTDDPTDDTTDDPPPPEYSLILLKELNWDGLTLDFYYNDSYELIQYKTFESDVTLEYNDEGLLSKELNGNYYFLTNSELTYTHSSLSEFYQIRNFEGMHLEYYTYSDLNTDDVTLVVEINPYDADTYFKYYDVNISYDSHGRVTLFERIDTMTAAKQQYLFTYEAENLIRIDAPGGLIYEFEFDDQPAPVVGPVISSSASFVTFYGMGSLPSELYDLTAVPNLHLSRNANNITLVKKSGKTLYTYEYEYNEYGYPMSILYDYLGGQGSVTVEYYYIE